MVPILVYDGECGFCRRWVKRWKARTGRRIRYVRLQTPLVLSMLGISPAEARRSVQLVEGGGRRSSGARAVFGVLARAPELRPFVQPLRHPPFSWMAEFFYRRVAQHRTLASRLDRRLFRADRAPRRHARGTALLSSLAAVAVALGFALLVRSAHTPRA
jgi:predicted DCC family thiol-disulfide oxidoreductase YuxK